MIEFKGGERLPGIFEKLPSPVTKFLGSTMSEQDLLQLAKTDQLEHIYVDKMLPEPNSIVTRSKARKGEERRTYELAEMLHEEEDSGTEDEGDTQLDSQEVGSKKNVRFDTDLEETDATK